MLGNIRKPNFNRYSIIGILVLLYLFYFVFSTFPTTPLSDDNSDEKADPVFAVNSKSFLTKDKAALLTSWSSWFGGEDEIEAVKKLRQNDSRMLEYIRKHHLFPPSSLPYKLEHPETDSGASYGLVKVIQQLLKNKTNGFFIEAGTNDGEHLSSTLGFERFQSWTGLCVEPSPAMQPIWRGKHRKAWFADVCLSPKSYPFWTSFLNRDDYTVGSKIGDPKEVDYPDHQNWTPFKVPCFPIYSLLSAMGVKEVDFFNLDVEGVEMDVLKNIPWKDILIKIISVELHTKEAAARVALIDFMTSQGYTKVHEIPLTLDYVFAHPSIL